MHYADFLSDVLHRILEHVELAPDKASRIEQEGRRDWGGERPYIAKSGEQSRDERSRRNAWICECYRRGERVALLARRFGVGERAIRKIIALGEGTGGHL